MVRLAASAALVFALVGCNPKCVGPEPCLCRDCSVLDDFPHCDNAYSLTTPTVCTICRDHGGALGTDLLEDGGLPDGGYCLRPEPPDAGEGD